MTLTKWIKIENKGKLENQKKIYPDKLIEYINENPDVYLSEIVQEFNCIHVAVLKSLGKLDITQKKKSSYKE